MRYRRCSEPRRGAGSVVVLALVVVVGCRGGHAEQSSGEVGVLRERSVVLADSLRAAEALTRRQNVEKDLLVREVHSFDEFMLRLQGEFRHIHDLEREAGSLDPKQDPLSSMESERERILTEAQAARLRLARLEREAERQGRELQTLRESVQAGADRALAADSSRDSSRVALESVRLLVHDLRTRIDDLQQQVDSLTNYARDLHDQNVRLAAELAVRAARDSTVYYVVGTRRELLAWHVAREVGGMPVTGWGKVLQPLEGHDTTRFTALRLRDRVIPLDSARTYQIISGQDVAALATPIAADHTFHGPLRIRDAGAFWRNARWLIVLAR